MLPPSWLIEAMCPRPEATRTGVALPATLGWAEVHLVAGFALVALIFALVPAIGALRQPVLARLRS